MDAPVSFKDQCRPRGDNEADAVPVAQVVGARFAADPPGARKAQDPEDDINIIEEEVAVNENAPSPVHPVSEVNQVSAGILVKCRQRIVSTAPRLDMSATERFAFSSRG